MVRQRAVAWMLAMVVGGAGLGRAAWGDAAANYAAGVREFESGDLPGAARALAQLAPFGGEQGAKARYLLGRVHQLGGEDAEALLDYEAVMKWGAELPGDGPEFLARAEFYAGVIDAEEDRVDVAAASLEKFAQGKFGGLKKPLGAEAILRIGQLQLRGKKYAEAIETLKALREDARFGDQALWFTGRAQIAMAAGAERQKDVEAGIANLKLAAGMAEKLGARDASARLRRMDELLEAGDAQMMLRDFAGAGASYGLVWQSEAGGGKAAAGEEFAGRRLQRDQDGMARAVMALELGGKYAECQALAQQFEKNFADSVLMGAVRFREAESVYLRGIESANGRKGETASGDNALLEEACRKLAGTVTDYPEYVDVSAARMDWGSALYRMGRYAEAADVLQLIPGADRSGALATAPLMEGDCLLRTLPADKGDALSAARMLQQAEKAAAQLSEFTTANPGHPLAAEAEFKLGYCYQRIAAVLAEGNPDRWTTWQLARGCYDRLLGETPGDGPLAAEAILERAKVLSMIDGSAAINELRRFQSAPLSKAHNAPLAILRLTMMLRRAGNSAEAAELAGKFLSGQESAMRADKELAPLIPMLKYEQGMALKDSGKWPEARAVFAAVAKQDGGTAAGLNSLWRVAQGDREAIAVQMIQARRGVTAMQAGGPKRAAEREAAAKELAEATAGMRGWLAATENQAAEGLKRGGEGGVRLGYELAWGYRALGELAMARAAFAGVIAAGDKGGQDEQDTANIARQDFGEMLAQRGLVDSAMDMFTEEMVHGATSGGMMRARVTIAECLLCKRDANDALAQVLPMQRMGGTWGMEARYVGGEAYNTMQQWKPAVNMLRIFEDVRYTGPMGDLALLALGDDLTKMGQGLEARFAYAELGRRYPHSPLLKEARMKAEIGNLAAMLSHGLEIQSYRNVKAARRR